MHFLRFLWLPLLGGCIFGSQTPGAIGGTCLPDQTCHGDLVCEAAQCVLPTGHKATALDGGTHTESPSTPPPSTLPHLPPPAQSRTCNNARDVNNTGPLEVKVVQTDSGWMLYRDDEPYYIYGVGGGFVTTSTNDNVPYQLERLVAIGGNSIRTWGAVNLDTLLDAAWACDVSVVIGIWLGHVSHGFDWHDPTQIEEQRQRVENAVLAYKDHPAVLMWGLGNEMEMNNDDTVMWEELQYLAARVHELDEKHPTLTVTSELGTAHEKRLTELCPDIDIWGINTYEGGPSIDERLTQRGYIGPYILTEYGPAGPWAAPLTSWNAVFEHDANQKAVGYAATYTQTIATDPRALGSHAFIWMPGENATDTWYSLFRHSGKPLPAVDALHEAWLGQPPTNLAPHQPILITELQNNTYNGGETVSASFSAVDPEGEALTYAWFIRREPITSNVWQDQWTDGSCLFENETNANLSFVIPAPSGTYRLFAEATDPQGKATFATTAFLVGTTDTNAAPSPPIEIQDHFHASGWMADWDVGSMQGQRCDTQKAPCFENCSRFIYTPENERPRGWAGMYWQYPNNNWGAETGKPLGAGATRVRFIGWSAIEGQTVHIVVGLVDHDPVHTETTLVFTTEPTEYIIDMPPQAYDEIITPFGWTASPTEEAPLDISFAGIRWE